MQVGIHERIDEVADAFRSQGVGCDASCFGVDGAASLECACQCRSGFGFNSNETDAFLIPGGDSADETSATDCYQERVEIRGLLFEFESDRALTEEGLRLIVGMDG